MKMYDVLWLPESRRHPFLEKQLADFVINCVSNRQFGFFIMADSDKLTFSSTDMFLLVLRHV